MPLITDQTWRSARSRSSFSAFCDALPRRSQHNKMVAGVAGGIAEYYDIDPMLVRVLFAVLTPFGGVGPLLYAAGWLAMRRPDGGPSVAEDVLAGRGGSTRLEAIGLLLVAVIAAVWVANDHVGIPLLVGAVVGAVALRKHLNSLGVREPTKRAPGVDLTKHPRAASDTAQASRPWSGADPTDSMLSSPPDLLRDSMSAVEREADRIAAEHLAAERLGSGPSSPDDRHDPQPPPRPRPSTALNLALLCGLLVATGALFAVNALAGHPLGARGLLAVMLGVLGTAIIAGSFLGRPRALAVLGVPLMIALVLASVVPLSRHGRYGNQVFRPTSAATVQPRYDLNSGSAELDLRGVDFTGHDVATQLRMGVGLTRVEVGRDVDVTLDVSMQAGRVDAFGHSYRGHVETSRVTDVGADGPGGGTLRLRIDAGFGEVEVDRVSR